MTVKDLEIVAADFGVKMEPGRACPAGKRFT